MATDLRLDTLLSQLSDHLGALAWFWKQRAVDPAGGFQTVFAADGVPQAEPVKTLIAQSRILWSVCALAEATGDEAFAPLAQRGFDYLVRYFHDRQSYGWYWSIGRDGRPVDAAKLMYGQSFGLYAMCAYARVFGERAAKALASQTFDAMHAAADAAHGGFWENLDSQWNPEETESGRRKSLDIHLHLLESMTSLAALTGLERHRRRLAEIRQLILTRMVDPATGAGGNQYAADFTALAPIVIDRTWIAERNAAAPSAPGFITTSYGHNLELGWLLGQADQVLDGDGARHADLVGRIGRHTLTWGYDHEQGGIYREGPVDGAATDTDKEFWQNAEALIGFLHCYQLTGQTEFLDAFAGTWDFARQHLIHPKLGEWRIRVTRQGQMVDPALGNQWTGGYHTVRAAIESVARLKALT